MVAIKNNENNISSFEAELVAIAGQCSTDMLNAIANNILDQKKLFQRQVVYYAVTRELMEEFEKYSAEKAELMLLEFNSWLHKRKLKDSPKEGELSYKVGFGMYGINEANERNKN